MYRITKTLAAATLALAGLTLGAEAQSCSSLAITNSGGTATIDLTGAAANSPAFLAVGQTAGQTVFDLGLVGTLTIDLAQPFALANVGTTDGNGDLSLSFGTPAQPVGLDLLVQGFTMEILPNIPPQPGTPPFTLDFCTSNVATLSL